MRKLIIANLLALSAVCLSAQVVIVPDVPPQGFQVLPGSSRVIMAQIGNAGFVGSGPVLTITLASGGTGYTPLDVGASCNGHTTNGCNGIPAIQQAGSNNGAHFVITSINSSGTVTGIQLMPHATELSYAGSGYTVANGLATTGGNGTGLTVNITSVSQCTAGTLACTVNWAISGTGGAVGTLTNPSNSGVTSISGAIASVQVNVSPTSGSANCAINTVTTGVYNVTSTAYLTITATATDSPNPVATFIFNVCQPLTAATEANGDPAVIVMPDYQQAFQGQIVPLQSWVRRNADESGVWSIVSQPAGGNGALSATAYDTACVTAGYSDCRDKTFSATVQGRYVVGFTSNQTGSTATSIIYVTQNALPSYAATPQVTPPRECQVDPAFTGPDFEVGPNETYHHINDISTNVAGISGGYVLRLHNDDLTGSNPTQYPEYFSIRWSGTQTNPVFICGVPDSLGNLPIITGAAATGQSTTTQPGRGSIVMWPTTSYNLWQGGNTGPSHVTISGIHFQMPGGATNNFYYAPGNTTTICLEASTPTATCQWANTTTVGGPSPIWVGNGEYVRLTGNWFDSYPDGTFTADNSSSHLYANITQGIYIDGNRDTGYFNSCPACDNSHAMYVQSYYVVIEGNLIESPLGTVPASNIKSRSIGAIIRYNYLGAGAVYDQDLVDIQDSINYYTYEYYLTSTGPWKDGDQAGGNVIAGWQEAGNNTFSYGNMNFPLVSNEVKTTYFAQDHDAEMGTMNGTLWYYNNTHLGDKNSVSTNNNGGFNVYYSPQINAQNNVFWPNAASYAENGEWTQWFNNQTNMFSSGSFCYGTWNNSTHTCTAGVISSTGLTWSAGSARGFQGVCDNTCYYPLYNPWDSHLYNKTSGNYLTTATQPISSTTMAPIASSPVIGAGSVLTGQAAMLPVRFQYLVNVGTIYPRIFPLTLGAVENSPGPSLVSIAITCPATLGIGQNAYCSAQCTYSDFSVVTCTGSATWTSSNTAAATVGTAGFLTGVSASVGTTTISASSGSVNSNNQTLTVTIVPGWIGTGAPCDAGQCVIN